MSTYKYQGAKASKIRTGAQLNHTITSPNSMILCSTFPNVITAERICNWFVAEEF